MIRWLSSSTLALSIALTAMAASGCQMPTSHSTTGWSFQVGRPPTISTPAAISQGAGNLALFPIGAVASASPRGQALLAAEAPTPECAPCPPSSTSLLRRPTLAAAAPPCDLNDVCARLERLERRLSTPASSETLPRPLPGGPSQPQP